MGDEVFISPFPPCLLSAEREDLVPSILRKQREVPEEPFKDHGPVELKRASPGSAVKEKRVYFLLIHAVVHPLGMAVDT